MTEARSEMAVLVLNHRDVRELLSMAECIKVVEKMFVTLTQGDSVQPLRWPMWLNDRSGLLGMMPGFLGCDVGMMGIKTVSVMPGNHGTKFDSHQGTVMLFEKEFGRLVCIADASEITAIRTAAASGVATKWLARTDATDLAILGSGVQARTHLEAMFEIRPIQRIRAYSPNATHLAAFVEWAMATHSIKVEPMESAEQAVAGADIICTTTSAATPILEGEWIADGAHINAVGSSVKHTRELASSAVGKSRLFVDWKESTVNEAGDYLFPLEEGVISAEHIIADLGEVIIAQNTGRRSDSEITLFKSLGIAAEDIAATNYIYRKALEKESGQWIEIGATCN